MPLSQGLQCKTALYDYLSNRKRRVKINETLNNKINNKINQIHEKALRITYNDKSPSFQKFLEKDNSVTIHHRNIKILATETYKFL